MKPNTTSTTPIYNITSAETAANTKIFSGGGFSNIFTLPSYQSSAMDFYLKNYKPPYGSDRYNNSGNARGYPDMSANGVNYLVQVNGIQKMVYGTSASAPVVGSMITLLNGARMAIGKDTPVQHRRFL